MDKAVVVAPRRRREHSAEFKQELVVRSLQPSVSVAAIAMEHGINARRPAQPRMIGLTCGTCVWIVASESPVPPRY